MAEPTVVQTVIVSKSIAKTKEEATRVAKDWKTDSVRETSDSWRFRQRPTEDFVPGSFRTKEVKPGLSIVVGHLKP